MPSLPGIPAANTSSGGDADRERPAVGPVILALELLLILLMARVFRLEASRGLFVLLLLSGLFCLVGRRLSPESKSRWFLGLSIAALPLALAWPLTEVIGWAEASRIGLVQAAFVIAIGMVLIAACHLPIRDPWRPAAPIALGAGLVAWRALDGSLFWPVLGSMFMFRLWVYLRAERHRPPATLSQRLSYFLMLPNAFFPFFPIVDYRDWIRRGEDREARKLPQRGVAWITRGMTHLLAYRLISVAFLPAARDVTDASGIAMFMAANYGLYLRISGHFHIVTGCLLLCGFHLPRTHDWYFLASNLSDIWRRINIYWKDFLNAHVFMPTFFSLRIVPRSVAMVIAVLVTFVATWLLHSWQAFWLLGDFPLSGATALLWLSAGTLVALSSVWQYRRARRAHRAPREITLGAALRHVVGIVATFTAVSFFWACWTAPDFPGRLRDIAATGGFAAERSGPVLLILAGLVLGGTIVRYFLVGRRWQRWSEALSFEAQPTCCVLALAAFAIVGLPRFDTLWGRELAGSLAMLRRENPTALGAGGVAEGYYEQLAEAHLQTEALAVQAGVSERRAPQNYFDATRRTEAPRETELIPNWGGTVKGLPFRVNRWGMRDKDVTLPKPPNTYRVAVLGSSVTMGLGVRAEKDFESLLEQRFNAESGARDYEFLNFAVGGYYALHSLANLRERALDFDPDAVIYVAHQGEFTSVAEHLAKIHRAGFPPPSPCLARVIGRAGLTPDDSPGMTQIRLRPYAREITAYGYEAIVAECRKHGLRPIFVYLPVPNAPRSAELAREITDMAGAAGFEVIDLSDWLREREAADVAITPGEYHVNAAGHRAIAGRVWGELDGLWK